MILAEFNRDTVAQLDTDDQYLLEARRICLQWLEGEETFTLHTSGSTGPPKEITVTAAQLKASVRATEKALSLYSGARALVCLNIGYVAGFMMLIRAMELDWNVVLIRPVSNPLLELSDPRPLDFTAMVPMQLSEVLHNPATQHAAQKLGKILLGGVGLTNEQEEEFNLPSQEVYIGYGMTETVSHVALRRLGSDERGVYHVTGDTHFGVDERGCLFFEGAVTGHRPAQTNDLAELIPGARAFRLFGRLDNVLNSGGIKIHLEELENQIRSLLEQVGKSVSFFLWKMPDNRLGEALVLVAEGALINADLLERDIYPQLERLKKPRKTFFTEQFLKTGSQKVDKYRTFEAVLERHKRHS